MAPEGQLVRNWVLFGSVLRSVGVAAAPDQVRDLLRALQAIDLGNRSDVRDASRALLTRRRDDIEPHDEAFDRFWRADAAALPRSRPSMATVERVARRRAGSETTRVSDTEPAADTGGPDDNGAEPSDVARRFSWSAREALRHKDFAQLDDDERASVLALLRDTIWPIPHRRTRRRVAARRGADPDLRTALRDSARTGGAWMPLRWRRRRTRERPLVVLCDISGSMAPYTRVFLQLLYTLQARGTRTEIFVFGTRLTRLTRELTHRDIDRALRRATAAVVDWGGGTRIGEVIQRFNHDWGRRVLGQGAMVAVISDGWDRGDVAQLRHAVTRLRDGCSRLLWLNPLIGSPGYQPLTKGIRAIIPLVDDFMPIHNLHSLEQLAAHLRGLVHYSPIPFPLRPVFRGPGGVAAPRKSPAIPASARLARTTQSSANSKSTCQTVR